MSAANISTAEGLTPKLREILNENLTIDVKTTAAILGIGSNQAYQAIQRKEIDAIRLGGRWLVLTTPLKKLLGADH
ncbi:hypothetical protein [Pseudolysinimonas sp.]|uniref:hypothetical protein n=1 Tax=Pseudolysinimonas sp. TaxID=2680009 RepID=UPI003F7F17DC